jgi:hypothetical protein
MISGRTIVNPLDGTETTSIGYLSGYFIIATDTCGLKPGEPRFFPNGEVPLIVLGAGVGVDVKAAKVLTLDELRSRKAELEAAANAKPAANADAERAALEADIAKLAKGPA